MDGKEYPIEVHLVHVNTKYYVDGAPSADNFAMPDGLAVLGIFYEISDEDNANLTPLTCPQWMSPLSSIRGEDNAKSE